jgi:hypothetical protein
MIRINAFSTRPFAAAVFDAQEAIATHGGWIANHRLFSDKLATIAFEMPSAALPDFVETLNRAGMAVALPPSPASDSLSCYLTITFAADGRDYRREVPANE